MAGDPTVWHVVVNISENLPNYIHLQSYSCTFMKVYEGTGTAVVLIYNHSTQYSTSFIRNFNYIQISSNSQIQSQFRHQKQSEIFWILLTTSNPAADPAEDRYCGLD